MRRYTLQDDYGGFDTRFIGITLRMWPKAWELHNHFMAADRDPGQVLQIGNKALRGSTEEAFEIFSIGTVLIHEMRHFHDFMLSPYGNHILRLRVLAAVNGLPLIAHMGSTVKEIPVPITKWGQLSEADKLIFSGEWQRLLGKDINIKLAVDKIAFAEVEKAYDRIKDFVIAPPVSTQIPYHPHHIFEASAIAVQINNVFNVFGIPHADLFANYLLSSDVTRQYTLALRAWQALTDATGDLLDIRLLSAAVVWSILGNYETTGWSACPTVRFAKLVVFLSQEGLPDGNTSIPQLFDYWSQRLDTSSSVKKAIEDSTARNQKLLNRLETLPGDQYGDLTACFRYFCEARTILLSKFFQNMEEYVLPHLYSQCAEQLPAAPIRLDFPHHFLVGNPDDLNRSFDIRVAQETSDGNLAVRRALLRAQTTGRDIIPVKIAADANDNLTLVDFIFSQFRRDDPDFDIVRQALRDNGLVALEIL